MKEQIVPDPGLSLGIMSEHDLDGILALERSSFLLPWSRDAFMRAIRDPNGVNIVAKLHDMVAGYLTSFMVIDEIYVTNLLVAEPFRRRAIGTRLVGCLTEKIGREGGRIFLEVRSGNHAAIGFYTSLNFQTVGYRRNYYPDTREDAVVMALSVSPG